MNYKVVYTVTAFIESDSEQEARENVVDDFWYEEMEIVSLEEWEV